MAGGHLPRRQRSASRAGSRARCSSASARAAAPPFREVVTHGFIVAEDGRKMSKSLGNSIEPEDIIKQSGADILRLWVSMSDYTQEVRLSKEILSRVVEAYRKIRNTLRFLLGNLYDFDPGVDLVERRPPRRGRSVHPRALRAMSRRAHPATPTTTTTTERSSRPLNAFATVDLSAFYGRRLEGPAVHVCRPLASSADRRRRRCIIMADGLTRLIAPILSFTADELWRHPAGRARGIGPHGGLPDARRRSTRSPIRSWSIAGARSSPCASESWPRSSRCGQPSRSAARFRPRSCSRRLRQELAFLEGHARDLPMLFIVSDVELRSLPARPEAAPAAAGGPREEGAVGVIIERADGMKCERCWRYVGTVSTDPESAGLCERCQDALAA